MTDSKIIALFFQRSEHAIDAVQQRYGGICRTVAWNLLRNEEDVEECLSDTWLGLWNTIPPNKPDKLGPFVLKITKNLAMKRLSTQNAQKRQAVTLSYAELDACIPGGLTPEQIWDGKELSRLLNTFLQELDTDSRNMFLRRYWFLDSTLQIAKGLGISETKVTTTLYRIRKRFKQYLQKEADIYVK